MNSNNIEHIESYLTQEITLNELNTLVKLNEDELNQEITFISDMQLAIEAEGLKLQLKKNLPSTNIKSKKNIRKLIFATSVAASILIMVTLFFFYQPNKYDSLYAQYKFDDPGIPITMSTTEQYELYNALTYYSEGDYRTTLDKLNALNAQGVQNDTITYFTGLSHLYLDQPEKAKPYLVSVSSKSNSFFYEKAQWSTALVELKLKDIESLKRQLSEILTDTNHPFYNEAKELLNKLE